MTQEEYTKTEREWVENKIPTMFYVSELQLYKNSLEARIAELESPKSCYGCKHSRKLHMVRYWCEELSIKVRPKFSCAYYEEGSENEN